MRDAFAPSVSRSKARAEMGRSLVPLALGITEGQEVLTDLRRRRSDLERAQKSVGMSRLWR